MAKSDKTKVQSDQVVVAKDGARGEKPQNKQPSAKFYQTVAADDDARSELMRRYYPLVRKVVHRVANKLPQDVDKNEMINSGMIGLMDALEKYDPKHETNFTTYAQIRIRGAIQDSFRNQDWAPRSIRIKFRKIEKVYLKVEQELGRPPEEEEVAKALDVDLLTLQKMLAEVANVSLISFDDINYGRGEDRFMLGREKGLVSKKPSPLQKIIDDEQRDVIARALDRLPEKERRVLTLYFYEELNLKEIGEIMDVTESRASQIRTHALLKMKSYLNRYVKPELLPQLEQPSLLSKDEELS